MLTAKAAAWFNPYGISCCADEDDVVRSTSGSL